jgi:hypothetical protein
MLRLGPRGPLCSTSADPFLRSARVNQTLAYTDEAFLAEVSLHAKLPCKRTTLAEPTGSVSCLGIAGPARSDCKPVQYRPAGEPYRSPKPIDPGSVTSPAGPFCAR